jgi:hypothetical protein
LGDISRLVSTAVLPISGSKEGIDTARWVDVNPILRSSGDRDADNVSILEMAINSPLPKAAPGTTASLSGTGYSPHGCGASGIVSLVNKNRLSTPVRGQDQFRRKSINHSR